MSKQLMQMMIAGVLAFGAVAAASNVNSDEERIQAVLEAYEQKLNASDVAGVVGLYAKDGVFMPQHSPSAVGIDAIEAAYQGAFRAIDLDVEFEIVEIEVVADDWAFARTNSAGTVTINATGDKIAEGNQELFVFQKTDDGEWKIARYSFSTTNPR